MSIKITRPGREHMTEAEYQEYERGYQERLERLFEREARELAEWERDQQMGEGDPDGPINFTA
jgi:hypothetical protein